MLSMSIHVALRKISEFLKHTCKRRYLKVDIKNNFSTGDTEKAINQNFVYLLISDNTKNRLEEEKTDSNVSVL